VSGCDGLYCDIDFVCVGKPSNRGRRGGGESLCLFFMGEVEIAVLARKRETDYQGAEVRCCSLLFSGSI
jgi:hypothetical protein